LKPQVLVLQNGARHNYAVPRALAAEGMLAGFYTDACGNVGLGKVAALLKNLPKVGGFFRRLANRSVPAEVAHLTRTFPLASLSEWVDPGQLQQRPDRWYANAMVQSGLRGANLVYSSLGWPPTFLDHARSMGVPVVSEFYVRPSLWRIHQQEHTQYPEWEDAFPYPDITDTRSTCSKILDRSDHLVVPTVSVKLDFVAEALFPEDRIHVIPYGISKAFFALQNNPVPGRVLFVGVAGLMKGIHYLAQASQLLKADSLNPAPTFCVAGDVSDRVRQHSLCSGLEFLGRVPRQEVSKLYQEADVVVFPTLSDSFGSVVLEAMAAGVPVISSPYCVDAVEDGISGFVVDPRQPEELAEAIRRITEDRKLRARFAAAARDRAAQFTWSRHQTQLTTVLREVGEHPLRSFPSDSLGGATLTS
jgi:glycosyltransferase involved in cell wall biosynthesis